MTVHVGLLTILFDLADVHSLKEKRSLLRPLQQRLSRQFNISIAETAHQDAHHILEFTIGMVNTNSAHIDSEMEHIIHWIQKYFPNLTILDQKMEII